MQALFIEISFLPDVGTCPLTLSLIYSLSLSLPLSHIVDSPLKKKKKVITSLKKEEKIQRGKGTRPCARNNRGKKKVTMKVQKSSISSKEIKVKTPVAFAQSNKV